MGGRQGRKSPSPSAADPLKLFGRCFKPLLKYNQRTMLTSTVNQELLNKAKQAIYNVKRLTCSSRSPTKTAKAKTKEKADSPVDDQVQEELDKLSSLISSIELMQNETVYSEQATIEELG